MTIAIRVPSVGQSAIDARIVEWCVEAGAPVTTGQVVLLVETDKTVVEVEAPADGVLGPHLAAVDDVVAVGMALCSVDDTPAPAPADRIPVSPRARHRAAELGVNLSGLAGTGPGGLVTEGDVERAAAEGRPPGEAMAAATERRSTRHRLEGRQLVGARRMARSWSTAPHMVQMVDADLTDAERVRRTLGATWTELAVAAIARALVTHPRLNSTVDGDDLVVFDGVNVGVAVDGPSGLIVPVVKHADRLSLAEISVSVRELAARARNGTLVAADLDSGTVTVSNLGSFGIRAGTPVLNPPESVLLFLGAVEERVVARHGVVTIRTMATLSVAFDHRATDGAAAARFTATLRSLLEDPANLVEPDPADPAV